MIHVIGDRRSTGYCIKCGTDLIVPWNDYQCCAECTKEIEYHKKTAEMNRGKKTSNKKVLMSGFVMRQARRLGGIPE